jgi:hypothetical protein
MCDECVAGEFFLAKLAEFVKHYIVVEKHCQWCLDNTRMNRCTSITTTTTCSQSQQQCSRTNVNSTLLQQTAVATNDDDAPIAAIIGGVLGGCVLLISIVAGIILLLNHNNNNNDDDNNNNNNEAPSTDVNDTKCTICHNIYPTPADLAIHITKRHQVCIDAMHLPHLTLQRFQL